MLISGCLSESYLPGTHWSGLSHICFDCVGSLVTWRGHPLWSLWGKRGENREKPFLFGSGLCGVCHRDSVGSVNMHCSRVCVSVELNQPKTLKPLNSVCSPCVRCAFVCVCVSPRIELFPPPFFCQIRAALRFGFKSSRGKLVGVPALFDFALTPLLSCIPVHILSTSINKATHQTANTFGIFHPAKLQRLRLEKKKKKKHCCILCYRAARAFIIKAAASDLPTRSGHHFSLKPC